MPMRTPIIENGAVVIRDGVIVACGKYSDLKKHYSSVSYHDCGEVILMPGLIIAHAHLDYSMMRGQFTPGMSFINWVQALNAMKKTLSSQDLLKAIVEGAHELFSWGCTSLYNVESFADLIENIPPLPVRLWQFIEVMDVRGREQGIQGLANIENLLKKKELMSCNFGISPHAPQTSSQELYRSAGLLAKKYQLLFSTHLAESEEEIEMFTKGEGLLFHFIKNYGRDMSDCGFQTPIQALLKNDLLPGGAMLVHMNFLNREDRVLLRERSNDFYIIHCPKTHHFFKRPPFDWMFFYINGYCILLGTDSLASNHSLNLFEEMQVMAASAPELPPEEILKMVTLNPALATGMQGYLGEISRGAFADMIAIPFAGKFAKITQAVIENKIFPKVI
jgi:cytosine/adenosine deaminase-related metal-dependent hydrolase